MTEFCVEEISIGDGERETFAEIVHQLGEGAVSFGGRDDEPITLPEKPEHDDDDESDDPPLIIAAPQDAAAILDRSVSV